MKPPASVDPVLPQKVKALQREVDVLREEREAILAHAGVAMLFVEGDQGEIQEANAMAAALMKYPIRRLIGMRVRDLVQRHTTPEQAAYQGTQGERRDGTCRVLLRRGDGTTQLAYESHCRVHRDGIPQRVFFLHPLSGEGCPLSWKAASPCTCTQEAGDLAYEFPNIVGKSRPIRRICELIGKVAKTESTVLIQGESGTGKEVFARTIHYHSRRADGPFVRVNCAALSETLLESELFGHVKGAFTGAIKDHKGRFGQADGGTILLDEIGSMSLSGQTKLLRVLQEREFEPVGSSDTRDVDVRVVATTNVDLQQAVKDGAFRRDLYYRLSVISIYLPPLRERKEDLPLLANAFLKKYSRKMRKKISGFYPETIKTLLDHSWPGNVRELENVIERAVVVEDGEMIRPSSLPAHLEARALDAGDHAEAHLGLRQQLDILERQIVVQTLGKVNWVRKEAALELGIDPRNFNYFLKKHNISEQDRMMQIEY